MGDQSCRRRSHLPPFRSLSVVRRSHFSLLSHAPPVGLLQHGKRRLSLVLQPGQRLPTHPDLRPLFPRGTADAQTHDPLCPHLGQPRDPQQEAGSCTICTVHGCDGNQRLPHAAFLLGGAGRGSPGWRLARRSVISS